MADSEKPKTGKAGAQTAQRKRPKKEAAAAAGGDAKKAAPARRTAKEAAAASARSTAKKDTVAPAGNPAEKDGAASAPNTAKKDMAASAGRAAKKGAAAPADKTAMNDAAPASDSVTGDATTPVSFAAQASEAAPAAPAEPAEGRTGTGLPPEIKPFSKANLAELRKLARPLLIDALIMAAGGAAIWIALNVAHPWLQILACLVAVAAFGYIVAIYKSGLWTMKTPALVAAFYAIVISGDQGVETLRTVVNDNPAWLSISGFIGFFFLLVYLQGALAALCLLSLRQGDRILASRQQALVTLFIVVTPAIATTLAVSAVTSWWWLWAIYAFLFCLVMAALGTGLFEELEDDAGPNQPRTALFDPAGLREWLPGLIIIGVFTIFLPQMISWFTGPWDLYPAVFLTAIAVVITASIALIQRIPGPAIAAAIVILIGFGGLLSYLRLNDNHVLAARAIPAAHAKSEAMAQDAFNQWIAARNIAPGKPVTAVIVAAEGGGLRAAYTTATVLEAMRRGCPAFRTDHFATIGVSGGSVGAALSAAAPETDGVRRSGCAIQLYGQESQPLAVRAAGTDLLRPVLRGMLLWDLPTQVLPTVWREPSSTLPADFATGLPADRDRTRFMTTMLDRTWTAAGGKPELDKMAFSDAWTPGIVGKPALILLTTDAMSGRRLAVSHLRFGTFPLDKKAQCLEPWQVDNAGDVARSRILTLADVAPGRDIRLMDGAFASARFPGVSPSGILPCPGRRWQVVDGGYFENSGLTTAEDMVDLIAAMDDGPPRDVTIVVLAIANSRAPTNDENTRVHRRDPAQSPRGSYLTEAFGPLSTFYGTRNARGEIARASLLARDGRRYGCRSVEGKPVGMCVTVRFVAVELDQCNVPVPLGWSLSNRALTEMREQLGLAREKTDDTCVNAMAATNRKAMEDVLRLTMRDQH